MAEEQTNTLTGNNVIHGIVRFFNVVNTENTRVYYTNLGGQVVEDPGLRIFKGVYLNFPWRRRAVRISDVDFTLDTSAKETFTLGTNGSNGIKIGYDADYQIKIKKDDFKTFYKVADSLRQTDDMSLAESSRIIYHNIELLLEQKVLEYINARTYDELMSNTGAVNLQSAINASVNGTSLAEDIKNKYGVSISKVTFRVCQPKTLVEEATATRVAAQKKLTAAQEQERLKIEEQGRAERMKIMAEADADRISKVGQAEAVAIGSINGVDPTRAVEAKEQTKQAQAYANGSATVYAFQGGQPGMMMGMPGMTMGAPAGGMSQSTAGATTQAQQQTSNSSGSLTAADWANLPDSEYLSVEDSTSLAAERGETIVPGGRYHISYLTDAEKQRYHVAAQRAQVR